jgi:hypothetical protein
MAFAVLAVSIPVAWWLLWASDPDALLRMEGGSLVGEVRGYLQRVDRDARTIEVSRSLLGFRAVAIAVTDETEILVNALHGGFGDLATHRTVSVSYVVRGAARLAQSIHVGSAIGTSARRPRPDVVEPVVTDTPGPRVLTPIAEPRPALASSIPHESAQDTVATESRPPSVGRARSSPETLRTRRAEPPTGGAPPSRDRAATPRTGSLDRRHVATESVARSPESSQEDGSSAVDWVLSRSKAR